MLSTHLKTYAGQNGIFPKFQKRRITKICWIRHLEYQSIYTVCIWTQIQNPKLSNYTPKTLCAFLVPKKNTYYILLHQKFFKYLPTNFWQIFPPWSKAESPEESYPTRTELQSINDTKSRCCDRQHLGFLAFLFLFRRFFWQVMCLFL